MFFLLLTSLSSCVSLCLADRKEECPPDSQYCSTVETLVNGMNTTEACHVALRTRSPVAIHYTGIMCPEVFFNCTRETSLTLNFAGALPSVLDIAEGTVAFHSVGDSQFPSLKLSNVRGLSGLEEAAINVKNLTTDFGSISTLKTIRSETVYFALGSLSSNVSVAPLDRDVFNVYFGGFTGPMTLETEAPRQGRLTLIDNEKRVSMKLEPITKAHSVTIEVYNEISVVQDETTAPEYIPKLNFTMRSGRVNFDHEWTKLSHTSVAIICYVGVNMMGHIVMSTTVEILSIVVAANGMCFLEVKGEELAFDSLILQGSLIIESGKAESDTILRVNYIEAIDKGRCQITYSRIMLAASVTNVTGSFVCSGPGFLSLVDALQLDLGSLIVDKLTMSSTLKTNISCAVTEAGLEASTIFVTESVSCPLQVISINVKYCGTTMPSDTDIEPILNEPTPILVLPNFQIESVFLFDLSNVVVGFQRDASVVAFGKDISKLQAIHTMIITDYPSRIYRKTCFYVTRASLCDQYLDHVAFSARTQNLSDWTKLITTNTQKLNIIITESSNDTFSFVHPYDTQISVFLNGSDVDRKIRIDMRNHSHFVSSLSLKNLACTFVDDFVKVESLSVQRNANITGLWLQRCNVRNFEVHYSLFRGVYDMFARYPTKSITLNMDEDLQSLTFYHDENEVTLRFGEILQVPIYNVSANFSLASYATHLNLSATSCSSSCLPFDQAILLNLYDSNVTIHFDETWDTSNDSLILAGVDSVQIATVSSKLPLHIQNIGQIDIYMEKNVQLEVQQIVPDRSTTMKVFGPDPAAMHRISSLLFNAAYLSTAFEIIEDKKGALHGMVDSVLVLDMVDAAVTSANVTKDVIMYPESHLKVSNTDLSNSVITFQCDITQSLPRIDVEDVRDAPKEILLSFGNNTSSKTEFHTTNLVCGLLESHCQNWLARMRYDTTTVTIMGNDYIVTPGCYKGTQSSCLQVMLTPALNWKLTPPEIAVLTSGIIGVISLIVSSVFIFRMINGYSKNARERQEEFGIV